MAKSKKHILVVDDEPGIRDVLKAFLTPTYQVHTAENGIKALELLEITEVSFVLTDISMPGMDGLTFLRRINEISPNLPVIVVSAQGDRETLLSVLKLHAFDFLDKPFTREQVAAATTKVEEFLRLEGEKKSLEDRLTRARKEINETSNNLRELYSKRSSGYSEKYSRAELPDTFSHIVTRNREMLSALKYIEVLADTPLPIMILGETGVGKDLIAQAIHNASTRKGNFVAANVAGLDDSLFSDTLFGHSAGAFTHGEKSRSGLIETAERGTLFLDEIGDLSSGSQVKLLRLLESGEYYPLGSDQVKIANARIVVATHKGLKEMVESGKFREDLYYRLEAHQVLIPPLRDRTDDIPVLVDKFIKDAATSLNKSPPAVPEELFVLLENHSFPGNVRELRGMVFDAVTKANRGMIALEPFKSRMNWSNKVTNINDGRGFNPANYKSLPTLKDAEQLLIDEALRRAEGNQSTAAEILGISRQALNKRLSRAAKKVS